MTRESFRIATSIRSVVCQSPKMSTRRAGWTEFADAPELVALLGLNADDLPDDFLARFMSMPGASEYVTSRTELPQMPPGVSGYLVPRTRFFINLSTWRNLFGDATTGLLHG